MIRNCLHNSRLRNIILAAVAIGLWGLPAARPVAADGKAPPSKAGPASARVTDPSPTTARSTPELPAELNEYVFRPDASFDWKLTSREERWLLGRPWGTIHTLELVSQTWQGTVWRHVVVVFVPPQVKPGQTWLLWVDGDPPPRAKVDALGMLIAAHIRAPFVMLFGVPNQPLLNGCREDALIAETLAMYLRTENKQWPLLFPMVKSVVRCMDALQAYAAKEWQCDLQRFIVAGASKRGWTAWLTAATGDRRVQAIVPLVFDALNLPVQMERQIQAFGKFSDMIRDYRERGLLPIPNTAAARHLWRMIDPWTYLPRLTMPKLIINGTNDPFWMVDALNVYWEDLPGQKWVLYIPNAGHYICERRSDGTEESLPQRAIQTFTAFAYAQIHGRPWPQMKWQWPAAPPGRMRVAGECGIVPHAVRLYTAHATGRDFRAAVWKESPMNVSGDRTLQAEWPIHGRGCTAAFVECEFVMDGRHYTLSSPIRLGQATNE